MFLGERIQGWSFKDASWWYDVFANPSKILRLLWSGPLSSKDSQCSSLVRLLMKSGGRTKKVNWQIGIYNPRLETRKLITKKEVELCVGTVRNWSLQGSKNGTGAWKNYHHPPRKLTWQRKNNKLRMYRSVSPLKNGDFPLSCFFVGCVSLPNGKSIESLSLFLEPQMPCLSHTLPGYGFATASIPLSLNTPPPTKRGSFHTL